MYLPFTKGKVLKCRVAAINFFHSIFLQPVIVPFKFNIGPAPVQASCTCTARSKGNLSPFGLATKNQRRPRASWASFSFFIFKKNKNFKNICPF